MYMYMHHCMAAKSLCLILLVSAGATDRALPSSYPIGDIRNCPNTQLRNSSEPVMYMDVLPGTGFDALRNLDCGQVYHYNFSSCQMSSDGLYLLPNNIRLMPILHSQVDFTADVYDHYSDWKSETSYSLNAHASLSWAKINGKFSLDYSNMKSKVVKDRSRATRISLRHHLYSVDINPDSQLSPLFKSRIFDIAVNMQSNNTKMAHYLSELLVRDYGTHVVNSVDAGAILSQTTFFTDNSTSDKQQTHRSISASASASFFSVFNVKVNYKYDSNQTQTESFQKRSTSSYTTTHGGPPFKLGRNFTYADWEDEIQDRLVAIDRRGEPLYTALTPATFPELPPMVLAQVSTYIYKAISRYYKINTHAGCTTYSPPNDLPKNFNFHANIDDGSCEKPQQNYSFGGIYQTCRNHESDFDVCRMKNGNKKNPLTGNYSCPDGYLQIPLHSGTLEMNKKYTTRHCYSSWVFFTKCSKEDKVELRSASYNAYWCALPPGQVSNYGFLFGGVYSSTESNIITGQMSCPQFYFPLEFAEDLNVCVSADTQGNTENLQFGGFYSCSSGNPMAADSNQFDNKSFPKLCPTHYSQLMVAVDEDCIINVCTDIRKVLELQPQPPVLPPFKRGFNLFKNGSEVLVFTDVSGSTWIKQSNGEWKKAVDERVVDTGQELLDIITGDVKKDRHHSFSTDQLAGIVVGTVAGTISMIAFFWIIGKGVKKFRRSRHGNKNDAETIPIVLNPGNE